MSSRMTIVLRTRNLASDASGHRWCIGSLAVAWALRVRGRKSHQTCLDARPTDKPTKMSQTTSVSPAQKYSDPYMRREVTGPLEAGPQRQRHQHWSLQQRSAVINPVSYTHLRA